MESRTCANYLIVGGGIAGVSCAEMLAINCPNESILLISASPTVKAVTNISNLTKLITTFNIKEETAEEFASKHRGIQGNIQEKQYLNINNPAFDNIIIPFSLQLSH